MSDETLNLTPELYEYLKSVSLREPDVLVRLRDETSLHPRAAMQISPEQGQFMSLLVKLLGVQKVLEIAFTVTVLPLLHSHCLMTGRLPPVISMRIYLSLKILAGGWGFAEN